MGFSDSSVNNGKYSHAVFIFSSGQTTCGFGGFGFFLVGGGGGGAYEEFVRQQSVGWACLNGAQGSASFKRKT